MIADLDSDHNLHHRVINDLIEELGLFETIIWTGYADATHVSNFLKSADAIVLPFKDGVSLRRTTFMTGIAHGLPVITTVRGEPPYGLLHRENVMLVPVGDAQALADVLHDVLSSSQLRQRLSVGAKKLARRFSWENIGKALLALYMEVTTQ
jgi:glycosyltransferase involved in cell wall biosynthesis